MRRRRSHTSPITTNRSGAVQLRPGGEYISYTIYPGHSNAQPRGTADIRSMTQTWDNHNLPATKRAFEALPFEKQLALRSRWYPTTSPNSTHVPRFGDINQFDAGLIGSSQVRLDKIVEGHTPDEYATSPDNTLAMRLQKSTPASWGTAAKVASVAALAALIVFVMVKALKPKRDDDSQ